MNNTMFYVVCASLMILMIFVTLFGLRWFNSATIQTKLVNPKEGVECLIVSTTDGASVDCWLTKLETKK